MFYIISFILTRPAVLLDVALLRDFVHYANEHNIPAAILALDQEKAFDRVDLDFLLATLGHMGFGPSFMSWVKLKPWPSIFCKKYFGECHFITRKQVLKNVFGSS